MRNFRLKLRLFYKNLIIIIQPSFLDYFALLQSRMPFLVLNFPFRCFPKAYDFRTFILEHL